MGKPRLGMFVLNVADMGRSLAFYRRLGMEFPEGSDEKTGLAIDIGGGLKMIWSTEFAAVNDPGRELPSGGYRMLVEFFLDGGDEEVDGLYASLTEAGYEGHRAPFRADFGAYMAMVDDPDGNTVLITAG